MEAEGRANVIVLCKNNLTELCSDHIQRRGTIFLHHPSALSLLQSCIDARLSLDRMKGLQSSADAPLHGEAGGSSKSVLWGEQFLHTICHIIWLISRWYYCCPPSRDWGSALVHLPIPPSVTHRFLEAADQIYKKLQQCIFVSALTEHALNVFIQISTFSSFQTSAVPESLNLLIILYFIMAEQDSCRICSTCS